MSPGTSGNLSARVDGGWIVTPTNASLAKLDPARLSLLDETGAHVEGDKPTKEMVLHLAVYRHRPESRGVVHLHSTHAVGYSCLQGIDPLNAFPPITPYAVMRLGRVAVVPYQRPGDAHLAALVGETASRHHAILMANHGPVVAGVSLETAATAMEELEEIAKLYFLLHGHDRRLLTAAQVSELEES